VVAHQPVIAATARPSAAFRMFAGDFLSHIGARRWKAGALLLSGALVEGVGVLMLLPILSVVLGSGAGNAWIDGATRQLLALAPGASPAGKLAFLLGLFAALLAVRAAVILRRDTLLAELQLSFVDGHRVQVIRAVADTRWDVLARLRHARITHVLGSDVQACADAANLTMLSAVALTMIAGQVLLVAILSPILAVIVLGLLGLSFWALQPWLRRSRGLGATLTQSNLALVSSTTQFLGGLKLAFSQDLQGSFVAEFEKLIGQARSRRLVFLRQRSAVQLALTAFAALVAGLAMLIGIGLLDAPPAALIAFLFVVARMNGPVAQLQSAAQLIAHSLPAYWNLKELEAELAGARRSAAPATASGGRLEGRIEFRRASFLHPGNSQGAGGLRGLDLTIEPASFVGVMGASGAGKTTFADLLVGLYPPQEGEVRVDDEPLVGGRLASWRAAVGYISQDPFLFHDTIRHNLLWARPGASEADLWDVLSRAGAEGLVRRMPAGLDTVVGESGSLVSGGERQRIALARALLRRPSLLLLDEATNAIDVSGEAQLLSQLRHSPERPTVIMIAHRDQSLAQCERILEFAEGRLVRDVRQ
jgi:ATP-binding cassette subfamily C protein